MKKVLIGLSLGLMLIMATPSTLAFASTSHAVSRRPTSSIRFKGTHHFKFNNYQLEDSGPENLFYYGQNWDTFWN